MYDQAVSWTVADGREARVEVGLTTERKWRDDWGQEHTKAVCDMYVRENLSGGLSYERFARPVTTKSGKVCVAKIGNLGLDEDQAAKVEAAIKSIQDSPEMAAHKASRERAEVAERKYLADRKRVEDAMRAGE